MESSFAEFINAIKRNDVNATRQLCRDEWVNKADVDGQWPINLACDEGHAGIVQLLLEKGAEIEAETKMKPQSIQCNNPFFQLLIDLGSHMEAEKQNGWRPLHFACDKGHVTVVQLLLDRGAQKESITKFGRRPIHLACDGGHSAVVQLLLDNGAELEAKSSLGGRRPIHLACDKGHVDTVQLLLDRGCQIEAVDAWGGRQPLHWACANGHTAIIQLLLDKGAQIEAADESGSRPIHFACCNGHAASVQVLLDRGCKIDAETKKGKTPLDFAKQNKHDDCAKIIEQAQENFNTDFEVFVAARKDDLTIFQRFSFPLWIKEPKTKQTLLDVIMQANAQSIIKFIKHTPVTDKNITEFLLLNGSDFSGKSYKLLCQWFVHCCIRNNIDWAFLRLCCAEVVNGDPLPDGTTCLDMAVKYRRSLCVRHILNKYIAVYDSWKRAENVAVEKGYDEIVELIRNRKTKFQRNASMGCNRLHLAVNEGDLDMVEYILRNGLVNHSETNQDGNTPLMIAAANRMDECVDAIRQHGADVDVVNKCGQTVLHAAIASRMDMLPQRLISGPSQVEQRDCMCLTALQQAVVANLEGVASQLVAIGADHRSVIRVNLSCDRLQNAIFKSFPKASTEHLELTPQENSSSLCLKLHNRLYPSFLDDFTKEDSNFFDRNNNSLLHLMAMLMNADGCRRLLEKGAAIGAINKYKHTPLVELLVHLRHHCRGKDIDNRARLTIRCLIDAGANISDEHNSGKTVLQMAIEFQDESLLLEMVRRDPAIKKMTPNEFSICVEKKMFRFLEQIIPKLSEKMAQEYVTADVIRRCLINRQHLTVKKMFIHANTEVQEEIVGEILYEAADRDDTEYFSDILRIYKANWQRMSNGESILTVLIRENKLTFCKMLFQTQTTSQLIQLTDIIGNSPLMVAIETEANECINHLIAERNAVDCENAVGHTALSMLLEMASSETGARLNQLKLWIKHLINASADIYRVNKNGKTAISFCKSAELKKEVETFCSKPLKPEQTQRDNTAYTAEEINICLICKDRKVNCVLDCGHTLCSECVDKMHKCPFCRSQDVNPKRLLLP